MAKDKVYSSILDSFLDMDSREPDWKDLGMNDAVKSGEEVLDRTHDYVDDLLETLTGGSSTKKASSVLEQRLAEKEAAAPRLGGNRTAQTRLAASPEDYKNSIGSDASLFDEVTESFDAAEKTTIEKKDKSDAEIQRWVKSLLNDGVPPAKVAQKIAELELSNRAIAKSTLDQYKGILGLATISGDDYMGSCTATFNKLTANGKKIAAKSVMANKKCGDCTNCRMSGSMKYCSLYKLPIVANSKELSGVVNKITAGVPKSSKKAALVQIANRDYQQVKSTVIERPASGNVEAQAKRANMRAEVLQPERQYIDGPTIQKLHVAGHSLKKIAAAAKAKFGGIETSRAIREFVASLKRTDEGNIVLAKADADFLKAIGIHKEITGAEKCMSCAAHIAHKEHKQASKTDLLSRVDEHPFQERTLDQVRASQTKKVAKFDADTVAKLHTAGHSLEKIYQAGTVKVGSAQARKAVKDFVASLKNTNTKVNLTQIDCQYLKGKLASQNVIVGSSKCQSCVYRNCMHCGFTGGTLLSFPGMDKQASNKKVAVDAPKDGYAMLNEFDLMGAASQQDIDMSAPEFGDVEMGNTMTAGEIE